MLLHSSIDLALTESSPQIAIVCLHYFGGSLGEWHQVNVSLRQRCPGCLTVAMDLRGHGQSPEGSTHSLTDMAWDVRETVESLDALHDVPYVVVGHSMGGKVALRLAALHPPRLRGLILIAPSPPTPEPMTEAEREANLSAWCNDQASRETLAKITGLPVLDENARRFVQDRARTTHAAWHAWLTTGSRENIGTLMDKVLLPTVVLAGENDPVVSPEVQRRETLGYVRNAFLSVVPNAGHLLPYEAPEVTADIIASSLPLFA